MTSHFQWPFTLLDPSEYLQLLRHQLPSSTSHFEEWAKLRVELLLSFEAATAAIVRLAQVLQAYPRLLHGANCLISPRYKIHCSTTCSEVQHFVISNQETHLCEIYSLTINGFAPTSSRQKIQQLLPEHDEWDETFGPSNDDDWLACVAQVLQEILDDPQTEQTFQVIARRRLGQLAKAGVLPPSVFVHFVNSDTPKFEAMDKFTISGGFCDAHKITVNNVPICFRVLRQYENSDSKKAVYKQFCREISVWHQLNHPNVLPLIGATTEAFPGRYCFIVPWLSNGCLSSFLRTHPEHDKYLAVTQIVEGLNYLHSLNPPVGHKDLKADNVLVNQDFVCVITDFGVSSLLDTQRSTTRGRGTHFWQAPEINLDEALDQDCRPRDIYSLGSTIAEILTGQAPKAIWFSVLKGIQPTLPPPRTPEWEKPEQTLWSLTKTCVNATPGKRPIISDIKHLLQASVPEHCVQEIIKACEEIDIHKQQFLSLSTRCAQVLKIYNDHRKDHEIAQLLHFTDELVVTLKDVMKRTRKYANYNAIKASMKNANIKEGLDRCNSKLDGAIQSCHELRCLREQKPQDSATSVAPGIPTRLSTPIGRKYSKHNAIKASIMKADIKEGSDQCNTETKEIVQQLVQRELLRIRKQNSQDSASSDAPSPPTQPFVSDHSYYNVTSASMNKANIKEGLDQCDSERDGAMQSSQDGATSRASDTPARPCSRSRLSSFVKGPRNRPEGGFHKPHSSGTTQESLPVAASTSDLSVIPNSSTGRRSYYFVANPDCDSDDYSNLRNIRRGRNSFSHTSEMVRLSE